MYEEKLFAHIPQPFSAQCFTLCAAFLHIVSYFGALALPRAWFLGSAKRRPFSGNATQNVDRASENAWLAWLANCLAGWLAGWRATHQLAGSCRGAAKIANQPTTRNFFQKQMDLRDDTLQELGQRNCVRVVDDLFAFTQFPSCGYGGVHARQWSSVFRTEIHGLAVRLSSVLLCSPSLSSLLISCSVQTACIQCVRFLFVFDFFPCGAGAPRHGCT